MGRNNESGQMTVEFLAVFPVLVIVAVIAVNALLFFSECASFDRVARDAVRVYAASPAYGQSVGQSCALIEQTIKGNFTEDNLACTVGSSDGGFGHVTFTAELEFYPTLFGMGLRSSVFGVALPALHHSVSMTVDVYRPGVLL